MEGLQVTGLPDSSWLPGELDAGGRTLSLWRRHKWRNTRGMDWWLVEYRIPGQGNWCEFGKILHEDSRLEGLVESE